MSQFTKNVFNQCDKLRVFFRSALFYNHQVTHWARSGWKLRPALARKYKLTLPIPLVFGYSIVECKDSLQDLQTLIVSSDKLFASSKFKESYDALVQLKDTENVEVLWRLSRGLYNIAEEEKLTGEAKLKVIMEAYEYISRARAVDDQNFAVEKWTAIILDAKTTLEGTKAKIGSLPIFREHILRAIELNPKDGTSLHMMGTYHYNISDLPWYQKKIASALFGKVPDASFEEALTYFSKAEEVQPNFYSKNLLMLGKTYMKLKMEDLARHWLIKAADSVAKTEEDRKVIKEAADLLQSMKQ